MRKYLLLFLVLIISAALMQGFQCTSKEITTAKVAMSSKDYQKAKDQLEKAIQKNPKSDEAWFLLGQTKENLQDFKGAAEAYLETEKNANTPEVTKFLPSYIMRFWTNVMNLGIGYFNNYQSTNQKTALDTTVFLLDVISIIRPDMPRIYALKGITFEAMGDTNNAILTYVKYSNVAEKNVKFGANQNIFLGMPREEAYNKFGKPVSTSGSKSGDNDSAVTELYTFNGKELYLYSLKSGKDVFRIKGWDYDPASNLHELEKNQWQELDVAPFTALASIYYERKDYNNSMKYVKILNQLQPDDEKINAFMVELYNVQGKGDEAKKSIIELIKMNPNNKYYFAQYGDILLLSKEYENAIAQYEKALKLDPDFDIVLRNIASAYKNKASLVQNIQREKVEKDKKYQPDLEEYFPDLRKSGEYFERSRKSDRFMYDLDVLGELINIYEVLEDENKMRSYLTALETLEGDDDINKADYYRIMCKVYTILKIADKRKAACDKFQELYK